MRNVVLALALFSSSMAMGANKKFTLESSDLKPNGTVSDKQVFNSFGCSGENLSPELKWSNPPEGTKSFALSMYDPDAPTGSGWWHWVVYNIPSDAKELAQGAGAADGKALPAGAAQGKTDFGSPGYGGPCPPAGDKPHHYILTLTALKVEKLEVGADASAAMVGFMVHANALGSATLKGTFGRKK